MLGLGRSLEEGREGQTQELRGKGLDLGRTRMAQKRRGSTAEKDLKEHDLDHSFIYLFFSFLPPSVARPMIQIWRGKAFGLVCSDATRVKLSYIGQCPQGCQTGLQKKCAHHVRLRFSMVLMLRMPIREQPTFNNADSTTHASRLVPRTASLQYHK